MMCFKDNKERGGATSGGMYGLGFIGALVFYMQQATSFLTVLIGIGKSLVWPAFMVYDILVFLNK